ncbi:hypothetical protein ZL58_23510 [Salmonella enterica subsp. enterica serovar Typhimurium]|nr:hypothetical protein [Salmonella enterica subsp. enterica serovar Typhimurium]
MNNIILYTPCNFTDLSVRSAVQNFATLQCHVKTVSNFSEFLLCLKSIKPSESTIVIIDLIEQSTFWRVNYLCLLWNYRRVSNNSHIRNIPFLLLGNIKLTIPSFLNHIPLVSDLKKLEVNLIQILNYKKRYLLAPIKKISKNKMFLLHAISDGFNAAETAISMNTSAKSIRNRQEALMRQMGLKNRYEVALLSGKILL